MRNPLQFLVVGPGLIGKTHCELISKNSDCQLVAIVAPESAENQLIAQKHCVDFFTSIDQALTAKQVDAAIVSSPNEFHLAQARACISAGVPLLVEKPLTDKLETARELAEQSETCGVPVLVGHHRMHSTLLTTAYEFMKSTAFGRLVAATGSALFFKPAEYFREGQWRIRLGGGPILINLIHEIGLLRHFCGDIETVAAISKKNVRRFEVEDTAGFIFTFACGAICTFLLSDVAASSKSWEMTSGENSAYPHFPDENCYHFAGTRGSLDFPSMQFRTYGNIESASWWLPFETGRLPIDRSDPLERQLVHFVLVVRGDTQPLVSARDGYHNMLVVEAIAQSIKLGRVVYLRDFLSTTA